ncbi:substrate-binding periplasmic protein [Mesorhizobium australicum]|uniref:substrate-binding periplasmic protein n=1 Tax=Mesorhizobium australicum TaxID=536018 RepID=UPI003339FD79
MTVLRTLRCGITALSLVVCSTFAVAQADAASALEKVKSSGEIQVGWAEWRPMEYRDTSTGDLKGVLIAFAEELAKRLGAKADFVEDNWSTLPAGIAADKFQIALMGITEARQKVLDFSQPLYHVPFTVIVKDSSNLKTFDQVNTTENSIAVTTGSSTDELLAGMERAGKLKAKVVRLKDVGGALLSVTTGKTTAFASSIDDLSQIVKQQKALRIVDGSFGASIFAVSHAKGQKDMNEAIDKGVSAMIQDGTVAKLLVQYSVSGSVAGAE